MQLSPHFSLAEFTKSDTARAAGIENTPEPEHLKSLQVLAGRMEQVREILGNKPILITSGYRNPKVNELVGGVPNSDHALGWACDFQCPAFGTPFAVARLLANRMSNYDQIIHEHVVTPHSTKWWVHLSVNPRRRAMLLSSFDGKNYHMGIIGRG